MIFKEYPDRDLLWPAVADLVAREITTALSRGERAHVALAGGSTPAPVYDLLAGAALDWECVDVVPTDERWVPEDDPRSNARFLRRHLLRDKAARAHLVSLYGGTGMPEESLEAIGGRVRALRPLNLVLLGMGEDGHVAGIFPDADNIELALSPNAPPVVPMRTETQPEVRVTLSAPVINGALSKHLLIAGPAKRMALEEASGMVPEIAPVNALERDLTVHWAP